MSENNWADGVSRTALVAALATRNEMIGELQNELGKALARIAELERQAEAREAALIKQVDCVIDLQAQLRVAQKILTAAAAWHDLRYLTVMNGEDVEKYYQACHDLQMAVLEFGAAQAA